MNLKNLRQLYATSIYRVAQPSSGFTNIALLISLALLLLPAAKLALNNSSVLRIAQVSESTTPPTTPGFCAGSNQTNANPVWYIKGGTPTCNFGSTKSPTTPNDYCGNTFGGTQNYFYECPAPASGGANPGGGSGATIICDGKGGVNGSSFPNGYVGPVCLKGTPSDSTWKSGVFNADEAKKGTFKKDGVLNYDVFLCNNKAHDFAPEKGNIDVCNKYPWTQDKAGSTPTPKPGQPTHAPCKAPEPYWDGQKCTVSPDACLSATNDCKAASACPSVPQEETEANVACHLQFGDSNLVCCPKTTTGGGNTGGGNTGGGNTGGNSGSCGPGQTGNPHGGMTTTKCFDDSACACGFACTGGSGNNRYCKPVAPGSTGSLCGPAPDLQCANSCDELSASGTYSPINGPATDTCKSVGKTVCCAKTGSTIPPGASSNVECSGVCYGGCAGGLSCKKDPISSTGFACKGGPTECTGTAPAPVSTEVGTACKAGATDFTACGGGDDACHPAWNNRGLYCCRFNERFCSTTGTCTTGGNCPSSGQAPTATPRPAATTCNSSSLANGSARCTTSTGAPGCSYVDSGDGFCQSLQNGDQDHYCYVCSGSTQSTGQTVSTCTSNVQCVNSSLGNACVFYGKSSIGICKTVQ